MKKQIIKNILFNILNFIVNALIGIMLTPYLIKHIGVVAYGMVPLALFITSYVGVLTQSLTASVNRHMIEALHTNDYKKASVIFNTALILMMVLIIFSSAIFAWPIFNISRIISVPDYLLNDTIFLFLCVLLGFFLSLISSIFAVSMYANNRIDMMQVINIIKNIVKLCTILILFDLGQYRLSSVGLGIVFSELIALIIFILYSRRIVPYISIKPALFDIVAVKKLSGLGGWLIADQVGVILLSKMDLIVVNKTFGSNYGGRYSIITQFSDLFRSMAGLVGGALGPVMMILHSKSEHTEMVALTKIFMKFMSLTMAVPVIVLCVFSKEIITLWIGPHYDDVAQLSWYIIFPLIINLGTIPLFSINIAMNKIKIPSISNIIFGVLGLILSIMLIKTEHFGLEGIAIGFVVATTFKNSLFMPLYAAQILRLPHMTFLLAHLRTLLFATVFTLFLFLIKGFISISGVLFFVEIFLLCILGFALTTVFYSRNEILSALGLAKEILKKNG